MKKIERKIVVVTTEILTNGKYCFFKLFNCQTVKCRHLTAIGYCNLHSTILPQEKKKNGGTVFKRCKKCRKSEIVEVI